MSTEQVSLVPQETSTDTLPASLPTKEAVVEVEDETAPVKKTDGEVDDVVDETLKTTYTPVEFALLFLGLALAVFLACLDGTIVGVTIPKLVTEFQSVSGLSWIFTAYLLTATPFIPSYGKLSDVLGRKPVFLFAVVMFEVGSAICGAATSMNMLIMGRAVAGLGGGGIFSLVMIIIADVVPIRDRPKYQGIIGAAFGLASVMGPLIGGYFTDNLSWRWCFYINLPIGAFTLLATAVFLKLPLGSGDVMAHLKTIDYLGTFLLVAGVIFLLVPLSLAGVEYDWNSGFVIGFLVACVVTLSLFVFVEARIAKDPVVPLRLFRDSGITAVLASAFFLGMCILVVVSYTPIFLQVVNGDTAVQAGIGTIPLIMSLVVFSILSGVFMTVTGHYQPLIPLGAVFCAVGGFMMSRLDEGSPKAAQIGYFIIMGSGLGLNVQTVTVAAQAVAKAGDVAILTANTNFWQQIGGLISVQIASSVFNNRLASNLATDAPLANIQWVQNNPSYIRSAPPMLVPPEQVAGVISAYVKSLSMVFILATPFAIAMFLASWFVQRKKLPKEALEGGMSHAM